MSTRRPARPKLTAQKESIVPTAAPAEAPPAADVAPADPAPTATLSLRVPRDVRDQVDHEIRRLHFETGRPKGEIAAELLKEGLAHIDAVAARLSAR